MNLEDQVCSLELAKKLKELRFEEKTIFYYIEHHEDYNIFPVITDNDREIFDTMINDIFPPTVYPAYTVIELSEILPYSIPNTKFPLPYLLEINKLEDHWIAAYVSCEDMPPLAFQNDKNLTNGLAKMLIYLLENELINNER